MTARYPLHALVSASGLSEAALARKVGLSGSSLKAARERGLVEAAADRFACRAGFSPWMVWPDWLANLEVECEEPKCSQRFVPIRRTHRFCSTRCQRRFTQREWTRRKYAEDEMFVFREKARAAAYYAECREYVRNRQNAQRQLTRNNLHQNNAGEFMSDRPRISDGPGSTSRRPENSQVACGPVAA